MLDRMTGATTANRRNASTPSRPADGRRDGVVRRRIQRDGVPGVLVRRDGAWSVENEAEIQMLGAFGRSSAGALDQFRALAETMNAGLLDVHELRSINGRLSRLMAEPIKGVAREWLHQATMAQVAFACVCMSDSSNDNAPQWVAWALSARLEDGLVEGGFAGPGWLTLRFPHRHAYRGFRRDTCWIAQLPEQFWARLRTHHEQWLRDAAAASDPRCGSAALRALARSDNEVVLDLVASHPNTSHAVLRRLALNERSSEAVRVRAAQNRRVSQRLLRRIALDSSAAVRIAVITHPSTSAPVVEALADDDESMVRARVARYGRLSPRVMRRLARDFDEGVRIAVATNPRTPGYVLHALSQDRIAAVRRATVHGVGTPDGYLISKLEDDRAVTVREAVGYWSTHHHVLHSLARDSRASVRDAVARNPRAPRDVLDLLATDDCDRVRYAVAFNESTPQESLRALAADDDSHWVRRSVAANAAAPADLLVKLFESRGSDTGDWIKYSIAGNPGAPSELLRALAADDTCGIRGALADNTSAPADVIEKLARTDDCWLRERLAHNRAAPCTVLAALAGDPDRRVRVAAARTLHNRRHDQLREFFDAADNRTGWLRACLRAASKTCGRALGVCEDAWYDFIQIWPQRRRTRRTLRS